MQLINISKEYYVHKRKIVALDDVSFTFSKTGFYALVGPSGCGKTTLLNVLGKLEKPTRGEIIFEDNQETSIVFQDYNLIQGLSLLDNIKLVGLTDEIKIRELLTLVSLEDKIDIPVKLLSGGEKQRVAIVRALAKNSSVILLDEPTASVDKDNAKIILDILKLLANDHLIIVSTHDTNLINNYVDYIININAGKITNYEKVKKTFTKKIVDLNTAYELYNETNKFVSLANYDIYIKVSNKQEIKVLESDYLKTLLELAKENINEQITVSFKEITSSFSFKNSLDVKTELPFKISLKYLRHLFQDSLKRTIFCFITIVLLILLAYTSVLVTYYKPNKYLNSYIANNNYSYLPIAREVKLDGGKKTINNGYYLQEDYTDNLPYFDVGIRSLAYPNLSSINTRVYLTNESEVSMTNFCYENIFGKKELEEKNYQLTISSNSRLLDPLLITLNLEIDKLIEVPYKQNELEYLRSGVSLESDELDRLVNELSIIYVPKTLFIENLKNYDLRPHSYFTNDGLVDFEKINFLSSLFNYNLYEDEVIVEGVAAKTANEVVISSALYEVLLEKNGEEVLGTTLEYQDFANYDDYYFYQNIPNMKAIFKDGILIKGVYEEDSKYKILCNESMYYNLATEITDYLALGIAISYSSSNVDFITANNDKIVMSGLLGIYGFNDFINYEVISYFLLGLTIIALILVVVNVLLIINYVLKIKNKDISIFYALGIKKSKLSMLFMSYSYLLCILAFLIGFVIGGIVIKWLNSYLMNMVYGVSTLIINNNYLLMLLIIGFTIVLVASVTILTIRKLINRQLVVALKSV